MNKELMNAKRTIPELELNLQQLRLTNDKLQNEIVALETQVQTT